MSRKRRRGKRMKGNEEERDGEDWREGMRGRGRKRDEEKRKGNEG